LLVQRFQLFFKNQVVIPGGLVVSKIFLMRIVRLILFCIVCFLVGVGISISGMYLPEFVRARNIFFRTVSSEASVSKNPKTENVFSDPLADPVIIEAKKMQTEVIDHLGANYTKLLEGNLDYLTTRDKIRSDYNA